MGGEIVGVYWFFGGFMVVFGVYYLFVALIVF